MPSLIAVGVLFAVGALGLCDNIDAAVSGRVVHIQSVDQIQPSLDSSEDVICLALGASKSMCGPPVLTACDEYNACKIERQQRPRARAAQLCRDALRYIANYACQ
jgi:hypothetical protein